MMPGTISMKALEELTGISRQTIHHWLREGVLPPPVSGAGTRNALYSERHVELAMLVRDLREGEGLSLDAVRRRLEAVAYDPAAVRRPPGRRLDVGPVELLPREELEVRGRAPGSLVDALAEAGVVAPEPGDAANRFPAGAVDVVRVARDLERLGFSRDAIVSVGSIARRIGWHEVEALSVAATRSNVPESALLEEAEARFRRLTELLGAVRREAVTGAMRRLAGVGGRARAFAREAVYVPSPLFVLRWGLEDALVESREAADERPLDVALRVRIGRLLLGLGRYSEAMAWLARAAELDSANAEALTYLGLARALGGSVASGVAAAREAVDRAPDSPRAVAFLGVILALQAASTTGLENPTAVLREALVEVVRSADLQTTDRRERLEAQLARGRVMAVLPVELDGRKGALSDLREVLRCTEEEPPDPETFDFPGSAALYRVNALYFLGMDAADRGGELATTWLTECIALDPASGYARAAYQRLGGS